MRLSHITISGFKSFAKKTTVDVTHQVTGVVGPNGSGKSNIAEAIRFVLGEQSMKSMRGKIGTDVIFKGSEHLAPLSKASVTMVIDNKKNSEESLSPHRAHMSDAIAPYLVYDEITLSRTIYGDGTSDYTLNDAKVRLKDVQELLSFAGIGGSAHTIINQGEADRILLASPKDRKEALEDALGLRVYHMRLSESTRKLERVKNHVREVELLRNEVKPHLQHLARLVEKINKGEEERKNLHVLLIAYLQKEESETSSLKEHIYEQGTSDSLLVVADSIKKELEILKNKKSDEDISKEKQSIAAEKERLYAEVRVLYERKDQTIKTIGRLDGEKNFLERDIAANKEASHVTIPLNEIKVTHVTIINRLTTLSGHVAHGDLEKAVVATNEVTEATHEFFNKYDKTALKDTDALLRSTSELSKAIVEHEDSLKKISQDIFLLQQDISELDKRATETVTSKHEEEKKIMLLESKLRELESTILLRRQQENELQLRLDHMKSLYEEGVAIIGQALLAYKDDTPDPKYKETKKQDLMRAIERSKLRIEEASIPNRKEILTEYEVTKERDEYLSKELKDIQETESKLLELIDELTKTLSERFVTGVEEVSKIFSDFFGEVFIGGKAKLVLTKNAKVDDEGNETVEQGIELDVSLPNKKLRRSVCFREERALVSIALLFAMSSITPPPFMVLDETDAPLDESNARKYGAMLKRLAEKSKLLVITHNRETMNHCDMLYGVTIGVDGSSKLLSINFKEAEKMVE